MSNMFILILWVCLESCCQTKRVDNICSTEHIKRVFLKLGESGLITAYNVTLNRPGLVNDTNIHRGCQVEVVTCPSCIIFLTFKFLNLNCYCGSGYNLLSYNPCRCDYIWVSEPPYDEASGTSFCKMIPIPVLNSSESRSGSEVYKSKTRTVRISLFYSQPHLHAFTIDYKSEPNRYFFFGTSQPLPGINLSSGFISSPFFPAVYPRDIVVEYVMTCTDTHTSNNTSVIVFANLNCRVRLTFTDFQLASSSIIEFFDGGQRIDVISGSSFRPPVITSSTNSLTVRFSASGRSNIGFKAYFIYLSENDTKQMVKPATGCGGFVDNFGGTITMMNMARAEVKLYDCIWLIRPSTSLTNPRTHLYLKISTFLEFGGEAELEVRRGLTSESPLLENVRYPASQRFKEHIFPVQIGFYVRLKAFFGPQSHLAIAYASFSYNQCLVFTDFLCRNYRCISKKLNCDGFDHCGDNSDEPAVCYQEWSLEPSIRRWYTHTPNYYFPKMKTYSSLQIASMIFLISILGLILFGSALTILVYRLGVRARERAFQNQLQSLADIRDSLSDEVFVEEVVMDDPPCYEPPPNYDDVVKLSKTIIATSTPVGSM